MFSLLYQRYSEQIFNYLLRLVLEQEVAEDLLQEVFVAIWRGASRFRKEAKVRTWIFRIAHNQAVSWLRRHNPTEELRPEKVENLRDLNPETQSIKSWQIERMQAALLELSPKHRSVVELCYVHGFSYRDIAAIMKCPVGTVKSRMSYAMRQLQGVIQIWGLQEDLNLG